MNKNKTVLITLEGRDRYLARRIYSQYTALSSKSGDIKIPIMDCAYNQRGQCPHVQLRINRHPFPRRFDSKSKYRACVACRDKAGFEFYPAVWYKKVFKEDLTFQRLKRKIIAVNQMYKSSNLFRLKSYPSYQATLSDIERDLDILEMQEGFIPDVILIDYADILQPETNYSKSYENDDATWKRLKGLAEMRNCAVFTVTQGNRASIEAARQKASDMGGYIGKMAHVDLMLGWSRTEAQQRQMVGVMDNLAGRHVENLECASLFCLYNYSIGGAMLDCEWNKEIPEDDDQEMEED